MTLQTVPEKGKQVFLRQSCNMCAGGETTKLDMKKVHPDNIAMFKEAVRSLGLKWGGIDFITPDITESYKSIDCGINEINKTPMTNVHYFADMKMDNYVSEQLLRMYFNL
jgi:cyanophycin synthetase